ncbi:MAG: hypothetical protein H0X30_37755 [Anaerolineae bacterium]|nr:hypothetical protein [Anaerolineae bacterium]
MRTKPVLAEGEKRPSSLRRTMIVVAIVIVIIVSIVLVVIPFFESGGGSADTRPVPGDAAHFDPVASYPSVLDYAGTGAQLVSLNAYYVRSDGTVELNATYSPAPYVDYDFVRQLDKAPPNAPPIGAGGANTDPWYEPIEIHLYQPGQFRHVESAGNSYTYVNKGMERSVDDPQNGLRDPVLPPPACPFAKLWSVAVTKDAPADAVAIITYDENGYDFSISGLSVYLKFDMDCKLKE